MAIEDINNTVTSSERAERSSLRLTDVFGLNRARNPRSYIVRDIERDFLDALEDDSCVALVVYGVSKQGKSSLLRSVLGPRQRIELEANSGLPATALYTRMLTLCNVVQKKADTKTRGIEGEAGFSWFKVKLSSSGGDTYEPVQVDLSDPSSVADILSQSTKRRIIVIDNFHYLDVDVQIQLATAIRTFEIYGFKFVIIGTWTNAGYLDNFNADLTGTVREFSFKEWTNQELRNVLDKGAPLLRVKLAPNVQESLIRRSVQNVAMLQELTKAYLRACGVIVPARQEIVLSDTRKVENASRELEKLVENVVTRNLRMIAAIGDNFFGDRSLSFWILKCFLGGREKDVVTGAPIVDLVANINKELKATRLPKVKPAPQVKEDELIALTKGEWFEQQKRRLKTPIVLYDDSTRCLLVCDSWTKFVVRGKRIEIMRKL